VSGVFLSRHCVKCVVCWHELEGSFAEVGQVIMSAKLAFGKLFDARHGVKNYAKHGID